MIVAVVMTVTSTATAAAMLVIIVIVIMTMVVTATFIAMDMAMCQLFSSGSAHVLDLDLETQRHARQRMVAIYLDELFRDFNHGDRTVTVIGFSHESIPFGDFHAIKQLTRHFLYQSLVILAVSLGGGQGHFECFTYRATFQLGFQARDQVTSAVQIDQRLFANCAVDDFTVLVGDCVFQRNHAQRSYFHVRILRIEKNGLRIP